MTRESAALQSVVTLSGDFTKLILRAQELSKLPEMPAPLKEALTEFVGYCDDTLHDCDLSKAVDRWDEGHDERERQADAYARDDAAEMRRLSIHNLAAAE